MKRMNMENMSNEETSVTHEAMKEIRAAKNILYLGGYDYSLDEVASITACVGILGADIGHIPSGITDEDILSDIDILNRVAKERREAGDQEYLDMIADAKEYVEQFHHDMQESIKTLERNGLLPGLSTPKSHSIMYG